MKIFTKKSILQKTILVILTVLCINFIVPTYSNAGFIGGVLINPLLDLTAALGDILQSLMQWCMTGQAEAGESLFDSNIMVDQGDSRIDMGGSNPTISVSTSDLDLGWFSNGDNYQVPIIKYTPEEIFSNKVPYLDINFINPKLTSLNTEYAIDGIAVSLQPTISSWYIALRNLSIVGLLCVLVYVGIKILLSSTAPDKAKYKQMFTDWLIALCILFFLHYIMSFVLVMIDSVNDAIAGSGYTADSVVISVDGTNYQTNMMGAARFMVQSKDTVQRFAYCIIYMALVAYTAVFTWHYLKRVLMMAFLTIIAPLVALTYPIDKMGDGKAQAFNMWLKEYVYNAIIQPFHLIIYMIFVGSAMDLAKSNFIYAIAAIAFILPAEKFLKKMFGFDRAPLGTMGALTGFTAGSLASKLGKGGKSSGSSKGGDAGTENKPPRYERRHGTDGIDYAENHNLEMGQSTDNLDSGDSSTQSTSMQSSNTNRYDEPIDVDYKDVTPQEDERFMLPDNSMQMDNDKENKSTEEQTRNIPRLTAEDVEEIKPDRPLTMDDLNNQRTQGQEEMRSQEAEQRAQENIRSKPTFKQGMNNIVSAHGGAKQVAIKGAKKLGKAIKFTARTGLTAAATIAGAGMGLAHEKSLTGAIAGATAGRALGRNVGRKLTDLPENAYGKVKTFKENSIERRRRTIDTFNGNTELEDEARAKAFMKDANTEQYIRDKWTKEHDGIAPTAKEVKEEKAKVQEYADEGMTDIAAIYRAQKAEKFGVSAKQSAKIALLAKDRGITSKELGDEKQFNQRKADFTQEFINKGQSEQDAARNADYVLNVMKAQVGQAHNLRKVTNGANSGPNMAGGNANTTSGAERQTRGRARTRSSGTSSNAERTAGTRNSGTSSNTEKTTRTRNSGTSGRQTRRGRKRKE